MDSVTCQRILITWHSTGSIQAPSLVQVLSTTSLPTTSWVGCPSSSKQASLSRVWSSSRCKFLILPFLSAPTLTLVYVARHQKQRTRAATSQKPSAGSSGVSSFSTSSVSSSLACSFHMTILICSMAVAPPPNHLTSLRSAVLAFIHFRLSSTRLSSPALSPQATRSSSARRVSCTVSRSVVKPPACSRIARRTACRSSPFCSV